MNSLYELHNKPLTDISFESSMQPHYDSFESLFCHMSFDRLVVSPELRLVKLLSPTGFLLIQDVQNVKLEDTDTEGVVKVILACGQPLLGSSETFVLSAKKII